MTKVLNRALKIGGEIRKINAITIRVLEYDSDSKVLRAIGTTVPTGAGYAKGATFIKTDAADGTKGVYENQGTTTSASFNLVGETDSDSVTSAMMSSAVLKVTKVTLTNAEVKALRAAPKTLVAAPGTNKVIEFLSGIIKLKAGANAITETADNMAVKYENGSGVAISDTIEATGFIDQSVNTQTSIKAKTDAIVASSGAENKAIVLHNTGDGEYAGNAANDATIEVYIAYRVHTTA